MFTRTLTPDWLAAFLRRERNSLHYDPARKSEFVNGYMTAVDGVTARLARELREVEDFDAARFLAIVDGRIAEPPQDNKGGDTDV